jgi:hypothetical protein
MRGLRRLAALPQVRARRDPAAGGPRRRDLPGTSLEGI